MKVERKCKIVSKDWLNRDAVYMVLEVGDMVRTSWKGPGQFVHIKCGDSLLLRRPCCPSSLRSGARAPSGWPTAPRATAWT